MARRRFGAPHTVSTKGHSILKQRAYGIPSRRPLTDVFVPHTPIPRHHYAAYAEEDSLHRAVGDELRFSSSAVDENYDMAYKSRDRDHQLMTDINQAIPPSIYEPVKRRAAWKSTTGTDHLQRYPHSSSSRMPIETPITSSALTSHEWPVASSATKYRMSTPMASSLDTGYGTDHNYSPTYTQPSYSHTKSIASLASEYDRNAPSLIMRTWNKLHDPHRTSHSPNLSESSRLLHGYISPNWYSSFRSPKISPYTSGLHTPVRVKGYDTPLSLESDDDSIEYRPTYSRRRKQLTGGGYYQRLLRKRASKYGNRQPRNWPYYDLESIVSSDLSGVLSDADSVEEYEYQYPMNRDTLGSNEPLIFDLTPRTDDDYAGESYLNEYDTTPSTPAEYVPYRPRITFSPIDSVNGSTDYESTLSRLPELSTVPYIPHTYTSDNKSSVADDIMFNSVVAAAAARARNAIQNVDLSDYDQASLVFSVEGEYNQPNLGTPIGFHYISRPLALKGPNLQGYGSYAAFHTDGVFDKYLTNMQDFRSQIRQRLEDGYRALRETTSYIPRYALKSGIDSSYKSYLPDLDYHVSVSPTPVTFRKRLEDGHDNELALYPLPYPERGLPAILHTTEDIDSESRLSTFDKVQIKAALIGQKVDVLLPERRMPKVYRSAPKPRAHSLVKEDGRLPSSRLHAHAPVHYPPSQAKAIRDVQGFTEPHNVMSWKYRLEARTKPGDMLFHSEHAYESMKDRVLDVHDKLDRHRQLLDRYLTPNLGPETEDVSSQVLNKYTELEARDPMGVGGHYTPGSYEAGGHSHHYESHVDASMADAPSAKPVSDLRKRLRRVICKSKRDAGYYH